MNKKYIDNFIGFVKLHDTNRPFTYKDWILTIYFDNSSDYLEYALKKEKDGVYALIDELNILDTLELDAIESNNNQKVKFKLIDGKIYPEMKAPGPSSIKLQVKYFTFLGINPKPSDETKITLYSKELENFLALKPIYKTEIKDGKLEGEVFCHSDTLEMESKGTVGDINLLIKPTFSISNYVTNFDFFSGLLIKIDKNSDIDTVYNLTLKAIEALTFVFGRTNIVIDNIKFNNWVFTGSLFINRQVDKETKEVLHPRDDLSINWRIICPYFVNLFVLIHSEKINLKNLQDSRILRYWVNDTSIAKDSSAFEAEFRFVFGSDDIPYHPETKALEDEVVGELEPLIAASSGKKKKIYKGFKSHVHMCSLNDKIEYCLHQYSDALKNVLKQYAGGHSFEEIAETCSGVRNIVDHGKKRGITPMREAEAFVILRSLIYAMQLRRIGMKDEEIDKSLCYLFKIYE